MPDRDTVLSCQRMSARKPPEHINDWFVWSANGGWDDASYGSVQDARHTTRGKAAALVARESTGHLPDVRVWKRYIWVYDRQDAWDEAGRERWADARDVEWEDAPTVAPDDWQPDEGTPAWEFVHRSHPLAVPVWVCGFKGDRPPQNPGRQNVPA